MFYLFHSTVTPNPFQSSVFDFLLTDAHALVVISARVLLKMLFAPPPTAPLVNDNFSWVENSRIMVVSVS